MQHALPQEYKRDIDRAYEADDLVAAIRSLTEAFQKRRGESKTIEPMRDFVPLEEITQGSKVVTDWRKLSVRIAPEDETSEDFLSVINERQASEQRRDIL